MAVARGWRKGKKQRVCLMGVKFQVCKVDRVLEMHNKVNELNTTEKRLRW